MDDMAENWDVPAAELALRDGPRPLRHLTPLAAQCGVGFYRPAAYSTPLAACLLESLPDMRQRPCFSWLPSLSVTMTSVTTQMSAPFVLRPL